jgi:hypothetical protein
MEKYALFSAALSVFVIVLLPLHSHVVSLMGQQDWINMVFGLPIGLATAFNVEIIVHKIRPPKK